MLEHWMLVVVLVAACGGGGAAVKNGVGDAPDDRPDPSAPAKCDAKNCVELGDKAVDAKQLRKALSYYERGCELDIAIACGNASMTILYGQGSTGDMPRGYALMIKACALNDHRSCNNAGAAWSEGINGASGVDHVKARGFYEKACTLNNGLGCFNLGNVFRVGEAVAVDMKAAFGHFKKSCELGEPKGCTELAVMYYEGNPVPKDVGLAKQLFERACKMGSQPSCQNLQLLNNTGP